MKIYTLHEIEEVEYTVSNRVNKGLLAAVAMTASEIKETVKKLLAKKASEALEKGLDILACETIPTAKITIAEETDIITYEWHIEETETI